MEKLCPLKFEEGIRRYSFGDRKIPRLFPAKKLPGGRIAETWEITAHPQQPGIAEKGPLKGATLSQLTKRFGPRLLGEELADRYGDLFPLLLKFLDARRSLSTQLHPDDEFVRQRGWDELGKPEAWYILRAEPQASLLWGLKEGGGKEDFRRIGPDERSCRDLLMEVPVQAGDVLYLPPGQVHAIGAGLVLFELQQTSDVTLGPDYVFRDGKRVEDFSPEESMRLFLSQLRSEYVSPDGAKISPLELREGDCKRTFTLASAPFALERLQVRGEYSLSPAELGRFVVLTALNGGIQIFWKEGREDLLPGRTVLLPAELEKVRLEVKEGGAELLKSYVPQLRRDVIEPLREAGYGKEEIIGLGGPLWGNDLKGEF